MGQRTITGRPVAREALIALFVLALAFLNFGHVAPSLASSTQITADTSFCGDPMPSGGVDHAPCHVCRIGGGADLPLPPATTVPVSFAAAPVAYADPATLLAPVLLHLWAEPRGPPAA